jgi:palmitoyltransferase ZDHHC9/14/18
MSLNRLDESTTCINGDNSEDLFNVVKEETCAIEIDNKITTLKNYGNLKAYWFKNNQPLILIGPHWPFYICLTTSITLLFTLLIYSLWFHLSTFVIVSGFIVYFLQITSYTLTFLMEPGLPLNLMNKNTVPEKLDNNYKYCDQCKIIISIEEKSNHCDVCNVCILDYDHHCPWTSKCIGRNNILPFYLFITFTMLLFGYFIFAISMINIK